MAIATIPLSHAYAAEAWRADHNRIGVSDQRNSSPGAGPSGGGTRPAGGGSVRLYSYWSVGWDGERFCRQRHVTTDPDLAAAYNSALQRQFAGGNAQGSADLCPQGAAAPPANMPTPDQLARDFWDVRILPAPRLKMAPGYAITGKPVYLEIGGEQRKHFDIPNPIGPAIGIDTTSRYVIDWGDGTVETTTSQGGPWPEGDLRHVYTESTPARTIRVQQQWSATWRAGDQQGTLDNLQTASTLTFEVTQVQAVRN